MCAARVLSQLPQSWRLRTLGTAGGLEAVGLPQNSAHLRDPELEHFQVSTVLFKKGMKKAFAIPNIGLFFFFFLT